MKRISNVVFQIAKWMLLLFEKALLILLSLTTLVFFIELLYKMPFIKDISTYAQPADTIAIANTYIVYITFIVVIGTVGLTLAGFYFQKSVAKREGEILNENLDKVIKALDTNQEGFRDKFIQQLLESKNIKPLIQKELDTRVNLFTKRMDEQSKILKSLTMDIQDLRNPSVPKKPFLVDEMFPNIKFDWKMKDSENEKL